MVLGSTIKEKLTRRKPKKGAILSKEMIYIDTMPILLTRKHIKNMYLRIDKDTGHICVNAPQSMAISVIHAFIRDKKNWIIETKKHWEESRHLRITTYDTGSIHYLWGEPYTMQVHSIEPYSEIKESTFLEGRTIHVFTKTKGGTEKVFKKFCKHVLASEIENVLPICEQLTHKHCDSWYIRDMKTRWGTCNTRDKRICLNLQLIKYPKICLTYVMMHEFVHFYERGHNERFYAYMDRFLPTWRQVKGLLR